MRLSRESTVPVFIRSGNRQFVDQECPFEPDMIERIVEVQDQWEAIGAYLARVYQALRAGADWTAVEVPECLIVEPLDLALEPLDISPTLSLESESSSTE